jgi:hypothetical protein
VKSSAVGRSLVSLLAAVSVTEAISNTGCVDYRADFEVGSALASIKRDTVQDAVSCLLCFALRSDKSRSGHLVMKVLVSEASNRPGHFTSRAKVKENLPCLNTTYGARKV